MSRCEDWPCCGHEDGCCPDFEDGRQINMKCVCGAVLPLEARSSICDACLRRAWEEDGSDYYGDDRFDYCPDCGDVDCCGDCTEDSQEGSCFDDDRDIRYYDGFLDR